MATFVLIYEIKNNRFCLSIIPSPTVETGRIFESLSTHINEREVYDREIRNIVNILNNEGIVCALNNTSFNDIPYYEFTIDLLAPALIKLLDEASKIMGDMATYSDEHYRKGITREEIQGIINKIRESNSVNANEIAENLEHHFSNILQPSSSCRIL